MSRVTFNSPSGDADLCGRERAHAGVLCSRLTIAAFGPIREEEEHPIRRLIPAGHYLQRGFRFEQAFHTALSGDLTFDLGDGDSVDAFTVRLNTAWRVGSSSVRLLARLHGQCEIHAWVDGHNRAWLANMIEAGRVAGTLRSGRWLRDWGTWEGIVALLRARSDEPVVMSYSVMDSFPDIGFAIANGQWEGPADDDEEGENYEAWAALPAAEQWRRCMEGLRGSGGMLEWAPENWTDDYYFGNGVSAFDLLELAEERVGVRA